MEDKLTKRQCQVAELMAWGASKKEVPYYLSKLYGGKTISVRTVENIVRQIYLKLSLNKASELSAWWFCRFCGVDESLSPIRQLKNTVYSIVFLAILLPSVSNFDQGLRPTRTRARARTEIRVSRRKD